MPYNFVADSFHTNKLFSRLSSSEVRFLHGKRPFCVFESPFWGLRATYDDHLRLIEKLVLRISDNCTFSLGVTAEASEYR